jgi:hypothetical protein
MLQANLAFRCEPKRKVTKHSVTDLEPFMVLWCHDMAWTLKSDVRRAVQSDCKILQHIATSITRCLQNHKGQVAFQTGDLYHQRLAVHALARFQTNNPLSQSAAQICPTGNILTYDYIPLLSFAHLTSPLTLKAGLPSSRHWSEEVLQGWDGWDFLPLASQATEPIQ